MNKVIIVIIVLLVGVGGYFLLRGGYQTPTSTPSPTSEAVEEKIVSGVKEITIIGTEFNFNPSSITLKTEEEVRIIFKNTGKAPHNLVIEDLGIKTKTIGPGQTDTIEFTASSSGTYTFFCSISGHQAAGMEGSLKIE